MEHRVSNLLYSKANWWIHVGGVFWPELMGEKQSIDEKRRRKKGGVVQDMKI